MFGVTAIIRLVLYLIIIIIITGGLWYVINLKADLAISESNNQKLEEATKAQNALIESMQRDIAIIQETNKQLQEQTERQKKDVESLSKKFDKDIGKRAADNPSLVERLVNRGTVNALRCIEIASGSPLTDDEKNAKSPIEANRECPSLINPNYSPTN